MRKNTKDFLAVLALMILTMVGLIVILERLN
jgi:hypothetical protein